MPNVLMELWVVLRIGGEKEKINLGINTKMMGPQLHKRSLELQNAKRMKRKGGHEKEKNL